MNRLSDRTLWAEFDDQLQPEFAAKFKPATSKPIIKLLGVAPSMICCKIGCDACAPKERVLFEAHTRISNDPAFRWRAVNLEKTTFKTPIKYKKRDGAKVTGERFTTAFVGQCKCGQIWILLDPETAAC